jgi:hypothetical protein
MMLATLAPWSRASSALDLCDRDRSLESVVSYVRYPAGFFRLVFFFSLR